MAESDLLTPDTLWSMGRIGSRSVNPKGDKIAYTVSYPNIRENKSLTVIYLMNADGSERKKLTQGSKSWLDKWLK